MVVPGREVRSELAQVLVQLGKVGWGAWSRSVLGLGMMEVRMEDRMGALMGALEAAGLRQLPGRRRGR